MSELMSKRRLLIIDDEENMCHMLKVILERHGYEVQTETSAERALGLVEQHSFSFVLCDVRMPGMDGLSFIRAAADWLRDCPVIMMSAYGSVESAIEAMKAGAYDFISKPFKTDEVLLALKKAEEREALRQENRKLKQELAHIRGTHAFAGIIAENPGMKRLLTLAAKAASYDSTVLITGESGTGKELMARGIHDLSPRSRNPFVPLNCGGIPENLLESELFGFLKGSFTGADRAKKGLFEEADSGTIFLDEIGELPFSLQVKLLRVLQEREIRPVGATVARKIDVRVLAATSRDLSAEVRGGKFREDLFYRLNVVHIHIPPLRDRLDDIPLLCRHFQKKVAMRLGLQPKETPAEVLNLLYRYYWPGNVRELENTIHRMAIMSDGEFIDSEHLPSQIRASAMSSLWRGDEGTGEDRFSLKRARALVEAELIAKALNSTEGNQLQASKLLQISYPSLLAKIKKYEIKHK